MIRYLALGDSYTIGEGVPADQRWPVQLAARLREAGLAVESPRIIARTGWTTDELQAALEAQDPRGPYDLVSLLIGVNNQYRGLDVETYRVEFRELLEQAIALAGGDPGRVVVLSIPDWGVTPFARGQSRGTSADPADDFAHKIAHEIDRFNAANRQETEQAGARYVNVTGVSREAADDGALLAADGLHPSGEMYRAWVELAWPAVRAAIGAPQE